MGYHKNQIIRGEYGQFNKITEEYDELVDASQQNNKILILVELSDLLGAIDGYTRNHFNISIEDVLKMTKATQQSFEDGTRKGR